MRLTGGLAPLYPGTAELVRLSGTPAAAACVLAKFVVFDEMDLPPEVSSL